MGMHIKGQLGGVKGRQGGVKVRLGVFIRWQRDIEGLWRGVKRLPGSI